MQGTLSASGLLTCSYARGVVPAALDQVLPPAVAAALRSGLPLMDRQWRGDFLRNAILVGPEDARQFAATHRAITIAGKRRDLADCIRSGSAGYAGGIINAAVDGFPLGQSHCEPLFAGGLRG